MMAPSPVFRNPLAQLFFVSLLRYLGGMTEPHDDPVAAAAARRQATLDQLNRDTAHLLDVCAERVKAGLDTADTLAARAGLSAVTIRKALRERGVGALKTGPKSRKTV